MESILKIEKIEKYYGNKSSLTKAIDNISFEVKTGEFVAIMGASGSGKTTLLKDIALAVKENNKDIHILILLIDERPEEVTDIKEAVEGEDG